MSLKAIKNQKQPSIGVVNKCCVFRPANGCSACRSLVKIDFLMLKQLFLSLTEQNKQKIKDILRVNEVYKVVNGLFISKYQTSYSSVTEFLREYIQSTVAQELPELKYNDLLVATDNNSYPRAGFKLFHKTWLQLACFSLKLRSTVAQMAERATQDRKVPGSIPAWIL